MRYLFIFILLWIPLFAAASLPSPQQQQHGLQKTRQDQFKGQKQQQRQQQKKKGVVVEEESILVLAWRRAFREGISGGAAGFVQVVTMMWLRTTVNYQYKHGVSLHTALVELYAQGGVARFYRGLPYALLQGPLCRFGSVAANEGARVLSRHPLLASTPENTRLLLATILGSLFSVSWRLFLMPLDTCKTVLQVDGIEGFRSLWVRVLQKGQVQALFHGSTATIMATMVGHSWFFVHNFLDKTVPAPISTLQIVLRSALIGFLSSAVSDTSTNAIRIVKTVKQSISPATLSSSGAGAAAGAGDVVHVSPSYTEIIAKLYAQGGLHDLFLRGLATRIISNGLQSMLFTVFWKYFYKKIVLREEENRKQQLQQQQQQHRHKQKARRVGDDRYSI